jgi:uncharacterized protein DUF1152
MIDPDELPVPDGRRVLVLGAGGGADVVAAEVVRRSLVRRDPGREVDIAGLLNPKFEHHYVGAGAVVPERAINRAAGVVRFRRAHPGEPPRSYAQRMREGRDKPMPDARLAAAVAGPVYQLSTRFGLDEVSAFAAGYDVVLACDAGGDILYGGAADNMARTPLMDAFSLALLRRVHARGGTGHVLLLGPGTDGELSAPRLAAALDALARRGAIRARARPSATDLAIAAALLDRLGESGGTTLRLMCAVRAALGSGARLPVIAGRDMEPFRLWVDHAYLLDGAALSAYNPLAAGDSMEEIAAIASALGWSAAANDAHPERNA